MRIHSNENTNIILFEYLHKILEIMWIDCFIPFELCAMLRSVIALYTWSSIREVCFSFWLKFIYLHFLIFLHICLKINSIVGNKLHYLFIFYSYIYFYLFFYLKEVLEVVNSNDYIWKYTGVHIWKQLSVVCKDIFLL